MRYYSSRGVLVALDLPKPGDIGHSGNSLPCSPLTKCYNYDQSYKNIMIGG